MQDALDKDARNEEEDVPRDEKVEATVGKDETRAKAKTKRGKRSEAWEDALDKKEFGFNAPDRA